MKRDRTRHKRDTKKRDTVPPFRSPRSAWATRHDTTRRDRDGDRYALRLWPRATLPLSERREEKTVAEIPTLAILAPASCLLPNIACLLSKCHYLQAVEE